VLATQVQAWVLGRGADNMAHEAYEKLMPLMDARGGHGEQDSKERAELLRLLHSLHLPRTATPATPTPTADLASTADGGAVEETVVQSAFAQRRVPVASRPAEPLPPLASLHLSCEISAPDSEDGVQQDEVCGL
jgi:hypothetical protein